MANQSLRGVGRLHVLTDTVVQDRHDHVEIASLAIAGGAEVIQLREKRGSTRALIAIARALAAICRKAKVPLLVNDRIDVALAADAHGVHLGTEDFPISLARQLLGPDRIIGASAGDAVTARAAERAGADYLGVGPIYATQTKADAGEPLGPEGLGEIVTAVEIPVIAIGGVTAPAVAEILAAGAHGVAVIGAVAAAADPEQATHALREAVDAAVAAAEPDG